MLLRMKIIWWALLGRPIIANCQLIGEIKPSQEMQNALIANNYFSL